MEIKIELIMKLILERLDNMDKWGGAHSELKRVLKSLPSYIKEERKGKKQIENAVRNLRNSGFIFIQIKTGEMHVSLNPKQRKDIHQFIDNYEKGEYTN